jgi:hypothetical protein
MSLLSQGKAKSITERRMRAADQKAEYVPSMVDVVLGDRIACGAITP